MSLNYLSEERTSHLYRLHLPPKHLFHLFGKPFHQLLPVHLLYLHHSLDILVFLKKITQKAIPLLCTCAWIARYIVCMDTV